MLVLVDFSEPPDIKTVPIMLRHFVIRIITTSTMITLIMAVAGFPFAREKIFSRKYLRTRMPKKMATSGHRMLLRKMITIRLTIVAAK